jgi:murein DD-endopeptidase MepM/ murein hydrolase activator NlpD
MISGPANAGGLHIMRVVLLLLALALAGSKARADIFRYLNDEGVECFTDAPTDRTAVRIAREPKPARHRPVKPAAPALSPPGHAHSRQEAAEQTVSSGDHCLPVSGRISSSVGLRHDPIDGVLRDHKGVDIAIPEGTPVRPVAAGVVVFSGHRQGYGNTVMVRHDDGMTTLYAHNSVNLKSTGEPVDRDSTIAFSGSTGRTTGPHLHFEAWKGGENITSLFIPGAASPGPLDHEAAIRRIVQADGTLFFTNH